jgi:hypothetical protein
MEGPHPPARLPIPTHHSPIHTYFHTHPTQHKSAHACKHALLPSRVKRAQNLLVSVPGSDRANAVHVQSTVHQLT